MQRQPSPEPQEPTQASRRGFVTAAAAGLASIAVGGAHAAGPEERELRIPTPDGECDAVLCLPAGATALPGVIVWPDAFGLRPALRALGQRLASQGYAVLVPNPFYRIARGEQVPSPLGFDWSQASDRARIQPLMASVGAPGAAERDARAFSDFLLAQPGVDAKSPIGVQGYCMGGPLMMRTAAAS